MLTVILVVCLVGFLCWAVNTVDFIAAPFKKIVTVFAVVVTVLWLISLYAPGVHLPPVRGMR